MSAPQRRGAGGGRPRSASVTTVLRRTECSKDVGTDWHPTSAAVALDLGMGVELCWPHSPEQKGSVENLVGWVKGSFFKQRRFVDKDDVLRKLVEWHENVNTKRPSRATRVIPTVRLTEEKPRLERCA